MWTRIINVSEYHPGQGSLCNLLEDITQSFANPTKIPWSRRQSWQPRFDPEAYAKGLKNKSLDDFRFSESRLRDYVKKVTKMRKGIRDQIVLVGVGNKDASGQPKALPSAILQRIQKGYFNSEQRRRYQPDPRDIEETPIGSRRRDKKRVVLDLSSRLSITHRVLVGKESQAELAKEYRVSPVFVSLLISKMKK